MTYPEALAYIASLAPRGWRLGLDRMQEFAKRADLPGPQNFIQVAGTNGKGSVTAYLQSLLVETGYETGAFFSPYVFDPRERVQYGRSLISPEDFARITADLIPLAESFSDTDFGGITEFEFKTAVGFRLWKEMRCEWVALEVGLGGRLDSTNIVTPRASAIVSIGLDHKAILGDTYQKIAFEKAGVLKPGVPGVVGHVNKAAKDVIEAHATEVAVPLWRLGSEVIVEPDEVGFRVTTPSRTYDHLVPGLAGGIQPHNMAVAIAAFEAAGAFRDMEAARRGVARAFAPGRLQEITQNGQRYLLDGAHNAEAAENLAEDLRNRYPGAHIVAVMGMVQGHEPAGLIAPLAPLCDSLIFAPIDFHRARKPEELLAEWPASQAVASLQDAIEAAIAQKPDLILITGSFYLVGEAGRLLLAKNG